MTEAATVTPPRRKLTTVLCADVDGFSKLTERDESGTLNQLKADRAVMGGVIESHRGRVVNTWGDGLLAEFESPVEAVSAAAEIQRALNGRDPGTAPPMRHRIGINLGDVVVDGDDLLGDGVNVANRLQTQAEPGGICISRAVYDQVRNKLSLGFEFLGERAAKNLADPLPTYRVVTDGVAASAVPDAPMPNSAPPPGPPPVRTGRRTDAAWRDWTFKTQLYRGIGLIVFLFLINLLTSPGHWWFKWPAGVILILLGMRYVGGRIRDSMPPPPPPPATN